MGFDKLGFVFLRVYECTVFGLGFLNMLLCGLYLFCVSVQEIYTVKLPGDPKLGEGKPENQNHAIIFTRGEAVQTIDMNQVTYSFFNS